MKDLQTRLSGSVCSAVGIEDSSKIAWNVPKHKEQGDLSSNAAMLLARDLKKNPREIAKTIVETVDWDALGMEKAEIAGPGFINVWVGPKHYQGVVRGILENPGDYGRSNAGEGEKILVEFVSANPTGPLNVVSARAAAIGDSLVRVLCKAGYDAHSEFYVNDAGRQIRRLGLSVIARAKGEDVPEDGYHGEEVIKLSQKIFPDGVPAEEQDPDVIGKKAADINVAKQKEVLELYGVKFDRWFKESELHNADMPAKTLAKLRELGAVEEKDGAIWFTGTKFGDLEDRVIVTKEGRPTYLLPDIAYHLNKAERGYNKAVDLLGPDHHDYIGRMKAALKALGHEGFLDVMIVQQVHLLAGGEKVKMSKRAGKLVTLEELVEEVGKDVARYFFLQRKTSSPLEFDLDLAKEQSDKNPVFYVQYAHARISAILRREECATPSVKTDLSPLTATVEIELIKHLEQFGLNIARAAKAWEPQRLVTYLGDLATRFHKFYSSQRVVGEDEKTSEARAALILATKMILSEGLDLLGVSAPERM